MSLESTVGPQQGLSKTNKKGSKAVGREQRYRRLQNKTTTVGGGK